MDYYEIFTAVLGMAVAIGYINHRFIKLQTTIAMTLGALVISFSLIIIGTLGMPGLERHAINVLVRIANEE